MQRITLMDAVHLRGPIGCRPGGRIPGPTPDMAHTLRFGQICPASSKLQFVSLALGDIANKNDRGTLVVCRHFAQRDFGNKLGSILPDSVISVTDEETSLQE